FDAGRIRANIHVQDARQEQALIRYEQTILTALEDVENALVAYREEQVRQRSLAAAVEAHRHAVALANELYTKGLSDFLNVLEAQRARLVAESQLVQSNTALSSHVVALYKALGGGWEQGPGRPEPRIWGETCSLYVCVLIPGPRGKGGLGAAQAWRPCRSKGQRKMKIGASSRPRPGM